MSLEEADCAMPILDVGVGDKLEEASLSGEEEGEGFNVVSHSGEEGEGFEEVPDSGEEEGEGKVTDPEWTCSRAAAYSLDLEGEMRRGGGHRRRERGKGDVRE